MKLKMTEQDKKRFWDKVNKTDTCWLWTAGCFKQGYGSFRLKERMLKAHRISFMLLIGKIKIKLEVCHTCNIKKCLNPEHLYLATHKQNMNDAAKANLCRAGVYKLTKTQVIKIRIMYLTGKYFQKTLAKKFNISARQISAIVNYENWKSI